jgi:hypothetical protein
MKTALIAIVVLSAHTWAEVPQPPKDSPSSSEQSTTNAADKQIHAVVDALPQKDAWDKDYIIATLALVLVGGLTFGAIWYQAAQTRNSVRAAERQADLTHRSMVSQFRPKLVVRQMFLQSKGSNVETPEWTIPYAIFNTGGTRAVIRAIHGFIFWNAEQFVRPQAGKFVPINPEVYKQEVNSIDEFVLEAGQFKELTFNLDPEWSKRITHLAKSERYGATNPQLVGYISLAVEIEYFDDIGTHRKIGLSRQLDFTTKRFTISDDPDFEYTD